MEKNQMNIKIGSVDEYIDSFPKEKQKLLRQVRKTILANAPQATETISYRMPAYKIGKKPLVYFAAFRKHLGFYATPQGHSAFSRELSEYKQGKGSVQFPYDRPIPLELIAQMVRFKIKS